MLNILNHLPLNWELRIETVESGNEDESASLSINLYDHNHRCLFRGSCYVDELERYFEDKSETILAKFEYYTT